MIHLCGLSQACELSDTLSIDKVAYLRLSEDACNPNKSVTSLGEERSPLARRLRQARSEKKISQTQLGILIGIDPSSASPRINQYESGKHLPDFKIATRLAECLDIPVTYLYAADEQLAELVLTFHSLSKQKRHKLLKLIQTM